MIGVGYSLQLLASGLAKAGVALFIFLSVINDGWNADGEASQV
jgi:hypothetical protein